ncbi:hypothetical protein, partial [Acinetobacter baumannii]|uniref:hypothetical protein n=1 Tax=Acinetobacter baumannii TaxID=470 RepID=UPI001C067462
MWENTSEMERLYTFAIIGHKGMIILQAAEFPQLFLRVPLSLSLGVIFILFGQSSFITIVHGFLLHKLHEP